MYGALLAMIFFIPYSLALIQACQFIMTIAWVSKRYLLWKKPGFQGLRRGFGFSSSGMGWPLIALGLLILLTVPFSHYPALSLKKFFSRFLQQVFLMYFVLETVHTRKRLYSVLAVLLFTFFLVSVDVMLQFLGGRDFIYHAPLIFGRVSGPCATPMIWGHFW